MTTKSPSISNSTDLILQLAGGDRNGQLLPVNTAKCLLSSLITDKAEAEKYRCAIFRGEKGVAFRSYSKLVLVNGTTTSVQWLKEGDTIQLTPEMKVVVKQLGTFAPTKAPSPPKAPLPTARNGENTISMDSATNGGTPATGKSANETLVNTKPADAPISVSNEAQVASTKDHNVTQRIEVVSDQLTSLVDAASTSGTAAATAGLTNQPAPETSTGEPLSDKKMADASSSIQDYLDKALASTGTGSIASPSPMLQTPVVAPTTPADSATGTTESRNTEATLEFPATSDPASSDAALPVAPEQENSQENSQEDAAKLRKEQVTSSLNRLLSETDSNPVTQDRLSTSGDITATDQSSAATSTDSVLLPTPTLPTTLTASEILNAEAKSPVAPPVEATPTATPPAATETFDATASVDAPKAQSLEFLKSLGIDASELGLSNTPAPENTTKESTQPELDEPKENATSSLLPTADEIIASASMGSVVPTDSAAIAPAEVVAEEEAPEPVAVPKKAESVADVLARMQNAGSLDSFSMDGPVEEASPQPVSTPTEVAQPKRQVSETVVADASLESKSESKSGGEEDGSVEDYMSQLLTRMRGGEDSEVAEDKGSDAGESAPPKEVSVETEIVETAEVELSQETLTPEQFVPKQKAVRMKSFDSLREIANNSNRSAIQDHLANQRKVSTTTKLQLAAISLGFGILFFAMSCLFSAQISVAGMFCGIAFLICGVGFAKFYRDEKRLDESISKAESAKA